MDRQWNRDQWISNWDLIRTTLDEEHGEVLLLLQVLFTSLRVVTSCQIISSVI